MRPQFRAAADTHPRHFACTVDGGIATVTLNRPERKNPLTFDSYGELRDWFRALPFATDQVAQGALQGALRRSERGQLCRRAVGVQPTQPGIAAP